MITLYDPYSILIGYYKDFNQLYNWLETQHKFRPNKDYSNYIVQYKNPNICTCTVKTYLKPDITL